MFLLRTEPKKPSERLLPRPMQNIAGMGSPLPSGGMARSFECLPMKLKYGKASSSTNPPRKKENSFSFSAGMWGWGKAEVNWNRLFRGTSYLRCKSLTDEGIGRPVRILPCLSGRSPHQHWTELRHIMSEKPVRYGTKAIHDLIRTIRGRRAILDVDLARIYGVATKSFNRAVKRNADRFPWDFIFHLTAEEYDSLRCQIGTSKPTRGGRRYLPSPLRSTARSWRPRS